MTENLAGPAGSSRLAALTTTVTRLTTELAAVATELGAVAAESATPPPASISPTLLTVEQAAARLGLSRSAVYLLIRDGELRSIAIGSRRRVPAVAVDTYVARLLNGAA